MAHFEDDGLALDLCETCEATWFDAGELPGLCGMRPGPQVQTVTQRPLAQDHQLKAMVANQVFGERSDFMSFIWSMAGRYWRLLPWAGGALSVAIAFGWAPPGADDLFVWARRPIWKWF